MFLAQIYHQFLTRCRIKKERRHRKIDKEISAEGRTGLAGAKGAAEHISHKFACTPETPGDNK